MSKDERMALSYYRAKAEGGDRPSARLADALEARIRGGATERPDHHLENAITFGSARALALGLKPSRIEAKEKT